MSRKERKKSNYERATEIRVDSGEGFTYMHELPNYTIGKKDTKKHTIELY